MFLRTMMRCPHTIHLSFWPYAVHHVADTLNNAPKLNGFDPKEMLTGVKGDRSFRNFYAFGSLICALHPTIADGKKLPP